MARRFRSVEGLQKGYHQIACHLHRLKAKDDFWGWVDQQFPPLDDSKLSLTAGAEEAIATDLSRLEMKRPVAFSFRALPLQALSSGFAFTFVWFGLAASAISMDSRDLLDLMGLWTINFKPIAYLAVILFWSGLCALLLKPFHKRWRAFVRRRHPLLSALLTSTVLASVGFLFYIPLDYLASLKIWDRTHTDFWLAVADSIGPGRVVLETSNVQVPLAMVGAGLVFWVLCAALKSQPWLVERKAGPIWNLAAMAVVVGFLACPIHYLNLLHKARQFAPEFLAYAKSPTAEPAQDDTLQQSLKKLYPDSLKNRELNQYCRDVLQIGAKLWAQPKWWESPQFLPLVDRVNYQLIFSNFPIRHATGPEHLNVCIRASFPEFSGQLLEFTSTARLSAQEWESLFPLTDEMLTRHQLPAHDFRPYFEVLAGMQSNLMNEGGLHRPETLKHALAAQQVWKSYLTYKDALERHEIYSQKEARELRRRLDEQADYLFLKRLDQTHIRRQELLLWFLVRIQQRLAAGQPLPSALQDFNPPDTGVPLDWFNYTVEEDKIKIGTSGLSDGRGNEFCKIERERPD